MARNRMLSKSFFSDPKVIPKTVPQTLVFAGCISLADDEGILEADPESMYWAFAKRDLPPEAIAEALRILSDDEMLVMYDRYAFLPNWFKHQTLNRPTRTKLKRPPRSIVERFPGYIEGWERTFSSNKKDGNGQPIQANTPYPFREDADHREKETAGDHGLFNEYSLSTHGAITPKGKERKRMEENSVSRSSNAENGPFVADDPRVEGERRLTSRLKDPIADAFEAFFWSHAGRPTDREIGRWRKSCNSLAEKVHLRAGDEADDQKEMAHRIAATFERLLGSDSSFWRSHGFTPVALDSVFDRVLNEMRTTTPSTSDLSIITAGMVRRLGKVAS
jgi:hypothetical protein